MLTRSTGAIALLGMLLAACSPVLEIGVATPVATPDASASLPTSAPPAATAVSQPSILSAFTAIPEWNRFVSDRFGVEFQYPAHWQDQSSAPDWVRFGGDDGFFQLAVSAVRDNTLATACRVLVDSNLYGSSAAIEWTSVAGQEACLITPSADQDPVYRRQSALVVRYPRPVKGVIIGSPDSVHTFFVLLADEPHIQAFKDRLKFRPPASEASP
jgi:hypothetical protein